MLSILHKPKADLSINLDDVVIYPGDTVKVKLRLTPQENFHIRSGTIELTCTEVYWKVVTYYTHSKYGSTMHRRNQPCTNRLVQQKKRFLDITDASNGMSLSQDVSFDIPNNALPSIDGNTANITWELKAKLDIAKLRDVHANQVVMVRPFPLAIPVDESGHIAGSSVVNRSYDACDLSLTLDTGSIGAGESLRGAFETQVKKPFKARQVRVELEVSEEAGSKSSKTVMDRALLENERITFNGADYRRWEFALKVPQSLPTMSAGSTKVHWRVKGILDERLSQDHWIEKDIQVY